MTASIVESDATAAASDVPEGAVPVVLPVMVIEGLETSDRRYIEPGSVEVRDLPFPMYAATRSTHGDTGDAATWHVGAITSAERIPGPEAQLYDGSTLPEGTFAWVGRGWIYKDVPAPPAKSAFQLVKDGALRGNSVDMTEVVAEFQGPNGELADQADYARISMQRSVIAATTLVGIPAFSGAYITLDGVDIGATREEHELVASAATPMFLSAELGDLCHGCQVQEHFAIEGLHFPGGAGSDVERQSFDFEEAYPAGGPVEQDFSTSGMVALVPANPQMLVVPGGDTADELHLTLAYLGDQVDTWEPDMVAAVHRAALTLTDQKAMLEVERARIAATGGDPSEVRGGKISRSKPQEGPLEAGIFAHAIFNPNGDNGHDPATVYLLDGKGDREAIEWLRNDVVHAVRNAVGDVNFPLQHEPFVPHVTAGYGLDPRQVTYTGPVVFDRIRVAIGDDVTDYPLGGGGAVLVASAADLPPVEWFEDPRLDGPTPFTVTDDGRVFGHMALWGTCHTAFADRCTTPPRSATNYAEFRVHGARARDADGNGVTVPVGYASVSRAPGSGGHAAIRKGMSIAEVAAHYDNTCTAAAEIAVGEDAFGIWVAGRVMPHLDDDTAYKIKGAALSGDWRKRGGNLELVAALAVNSPGFPVPFRALVASGEPLALVAAGTLAASPPPPEEPVTDRLTALYGMMQGVAADQLVTLTDDAPTYAAMQSAHEVDMLLAFNADHPWLGGEFADEWAEVFAATNDDAFAKKANWVTKAGGLPKYIKRIAKHLQEKGMDQSRAIATAVNAAKKMCSTGDTNWPGSQQVNAGSRAEACAAVASWEEKKAKS